MNTQSFETPQQIAARLSPREFERLVRSYILRELERLPKANRKLSLFYTDYKDSFEWSVGDSYASSPTATKGEILADVVTEQMRRLGFVESCKLDLIEFKAEESEETSF